jgi:hypothetical protein
VEAIKYEIPVELSEMEYIFGTRARGAEKAPMKSDERRLTARVQLVACTNAATTRDGSAGRKVNELR